MEKVKVIEHKLTISDGKEAKTLPCTLMFEEEKCRIFFELPYKQRDFIHIKIGPITKKKSRKIKNGWAGFCGGGD